MADILVDATILIDMAIMNNWRFNLVVADPRLLDAGHAGIRWEVLGRYSELITLADVG